MEIISKNLITVLQYRIKMEEESSRLYLAMSVWLEKHGFMGAAALWKKYSQEEMIHAQWVYDYLLGLSIKPIVPELSAPECDFDGLPDIIRRTLEHEIDITQQCNDFAKLAKEENDFMAFDFALKFLREQHEELTKTSGWVDELETFGTSLEALRLLDHKMEHYVNPNL
jgi:ferritin